MSKLDEREQFWIEKMSTYEEGYNRTRGGQGGRATLSKDQVAEVLYEYENDTQSSVEEICQCNGISQATLSRLRQAFGINQREKTSFEIASSIENAKKATLARQVRVQNIDLDTIYPSKKSALIDMIDKGYSKASDWHNIRAPLDKALKDPSKKFLGFSWRIVEKGGL